MEVQIIKLNVQCWDECVIEIGIDQVIKLQLQLNASTLISSALLTDLFGMVSHTLDVFQCNALQHNLC